MTSIKKKIFFYVQHLHGLGHVFRASRIAQALQKKGFELHLIWGGHKVKSIDLTNLNPFYLPTLYCNVNDYSTLLDKDNKPVSADFLEERKNLLLEHYSEIKPDIVITETFPFGRRQMRFELLPLMDKIQEENKQKKVQNKETIKVFTSVRDIVQQNRKPKSQKDTIDYLEKYFDMILVHGDERFTKITETVPGLEKQENKIKYTGIVAPKKDNRKENAAFPHPDILVSGGGGAAAYKLIETALKAASISVENNQNWLISTGPYMPEEDFKNLELTKPNNVKLVKFIDDFSELIKKVKVSVSLCGYNTAADILAAKVPAIVVPSVAGKETEQLFRAKKLDSLGWAKMILPENLTPEALVKELNQIDQLTKINFDVDLNGAENAAQIVSESH